MHHMCTCLSSTTELAERWHCTDFLQERMACIPYTVYVWSSLFQPSCWPIMGLKMLLKSDGHEHSLKLCTHTNICIQMNVHVAIGLHGVHCYVSTFSNSAMTCQNLNKAISSHIVPYAICGFIISKCVHMQ